jgi:Single-strand binding protein family
MLKVVKEAEGWDIEGLSKALGAEGRPHQDVIWGDGHRFFLHEIPAELELYPEKMVVRYHSPAVYLAMSDVSIENDAAGVRLTAEDSKSRTVVSLFKAEGVISLAQPIPEEAAAPAVAEDARSAAQSTNKSDGNKNNNNTAEHRESPDRVTITGNVGRDPDVRTTAKGRKILKFPLGVHEEAGKTSWHEILFFDGKAEKVAEQISKGRLVTVVGYKHEREAEIKKGNTTFKKKVVEIYGATVQMPKGPNTKVSQ